MFSITFFRRLGIFLALVSLLLLVFFPELAWGRPGGGHSYSGGGSSGGGYSGGGGYSSGGSSSGDGDIGVLIYIFLSLPYPVQILIVIVGVIAFFMHHRRGQADGTRVSNYVRSSGSDRQYHNQAANTTKQRQIDTLVAQDPQFSEVLFLDFAHSLYHKLYTNLGKSALKDVKPFLSDSVKVQLDVANYQHPRTEVVVGNLQLVDIDIYPNFVSITVDFETNFTTVRQGKSFRHILQERWALVRKGVHEAKDPEAMRNLACPNCGAPSDFTDAGTCGYCNTQIVAGEMTWMVQKIVVQEHEHVRAASLGHYAPEVGNNTPTLFDPFLQEKGAAFIQRHQLANPSTYWDTFMGNVVQETFVAMYNAWSDRDNWDSVRHLLSDRLHESNSFWIRLYQEQDYFNRLRNIQLQKIEPVKITSDNYYEAITVRIFASAIDYTEHSSGRLIGGNKNSPRRFSEYWTFVRKIGVEKPEESFDVHQCPNCGAPADKISDSAVCSYCGAKTNLGDFSWVLSNIAQDEAYKG
ncbi:MAG: TIM44-like domain-containing protein [Aureispira sp.]